MMLHNRKINQEEDLRVSWDDTVVFLPPPYIHLLPSEVCQVYFFIAVL